MVVADDRQHTAMIGGAGSVGMFEHVTCAVDTRGLAVPDAEQAIIFCAGEQAELLAAPDGSCAKVFVQAFPELDIVRVEPFLRGTQLLVVAAQRRAAIPGNEAGRVQILTQIETFAIKW